MFEPIEYEELKRFEQHDKVNVFHQVLSDKKTVVDWYEMKNTGDSIFKENTFHFENCIPLKKETTTLDILFPEEEAKFDLIKIDTQGAEIPILKGGRKLIQKASFIMLELPFLGQYNKGVPNFLESIQYMDSVGFVPFDIVDLHRASNI